MASLAWSGILRYREVVFAGGGSPTICVNVVAATDLWSEISREEGSDLISFCSVLWGVVC